MIWLELSVKLDITLRQKKISVDTYEAVRVELRSKVVLIL